MISKLLLEKARERWMLLAYGKGSGDGTASLWYREDVPLFGQALFTYHVLCRSVVRTGKRALSECPELAGKESGLQLANCLRSLESWLESAGELDAQG